MSEFALEITDLKKIYDSNVVALKGINLAVKEGDFLHCLDQMELENLLQLESLLR